MIRYVEHHHIDREKYDHCVRMDSNNLIYGYSWYLNVLCNGWDALVLDDYKAVWPLPYRKKFTFKYFYRPFGIQQLGIFSLQPLSDKTVGDFIAKMQNHCSYADIYLSEEQGLSLKAFSKTEFILNRNYTLNLEHSFREIYHGYHKHTRRQIKKTDKELLIFENDSPDVLLKLFRENKGQSLNLTENFYQSVQKIMYQCLHKNIGKLWTVYGAGNTLIGGAFFIQNSKRHTLFFTALSDAGKEAGAMYYLLNEYIIYFSDKPVLLDFEGSNDKGVARFYNGFGARESYYLNLRYNNLPLPLRWIKRH